MAKSTRKSISVPKLDSGTNVTFTVQLEGEMNWNECFAGTYVAGEGGLFDPSSTNKALTKETFQEALQYHLASILFASPSADHGYHSYHSYRITKISVPKEIEAIYNNAKVSSNEQEKLEAQEELKRLEAEEKALQERKRQLKLKVG